MSVRNRAWRARQRRQARLASTASIQLLQDEAWDALAADAGSCAAPRPVRVAIPDCLKPEDEVRFQCAFEEAAFDLPPGATQEQFQACADEAWNVCFGFDVELTERDKIWGSVPRWCLVDKTFIAALARALPESMEATGEFSDEELRRALEDAWAKTQGDNGQ